MLRLLETNVCEISQLFESFFAGSLVLGVGNSILDSFNELCKLFNNQLACSLVNSGGKNPHGLTHEIAEF